MERKKTIYFVIAVLCLGAIAGGIWAWKSYHETRPELAFVTPEIRISAIALSQAFSKDENAANEVYLNKILEVSGIVEAVHQSNKRIVIEMQTGPNTIGSINFVMRNTSPLPVKGDELKIKGRCTGYLMDVNIVDAVITQ